MVVDEDDTHWRGGGGEQFSSVSSGGGRGHARWVKVHSVPGSSRRTFALPPTRVIRPLDRLAHAEPILGDGIEIQARAVVAHKGLIRSGPHST